MVSATNIKLKKDLISTNDDKLLNLLTLLFQSTKKKRILIFIFLQKYWRHFYFNQSNNSFNYFLKLLH